MAFMKPKKKATPGISGPLSAQKLITRGVKSAGKAPAKKAPMKKAAPSPMKKVTTKKK